jgi:leader peptidase (prepilin peptidase) / N-methyltransferase
MPWVVPAAGAAAGLAAWSAGTGPLLPLLPVLLLAVVLGVLLAAVDLRCLRLPDPLVATLALLVCPPLAAAALLAGDPARLARAVLAAVLVGAGYLALALAGGLGLGDVKLAAVLAFPLGFVGWPAVVLGLVVPHLLNGPVALLMLARGRFSRRGALPLGPALLAGALAGLVFGQ